MRHIICHSWYRLSALEWWFSKPIKPTEAKVAMLGLDGAGKTSILYRMILNEDVTNLTGQKDGFVGLRCGLEPLNIIPGLNLQICDLDGSKNARSLWMNYISRQGHKNGRVSNFFLIGIFVVHHKYERTYLGGRLGRQRSFQRKSWWIDEFIAI